MIDFDKTIAKLFDDSFCQQLEYHLSRTFENSRTDRFEYIWCDGIEVPERGNQFLSDFLETREVITCAWLGLNGQDRYLMTIKLGDDSLKQFLGGASLINCLPGDGSLDWVKLDERNKTIILSLK